jgi:hypothetical protein
MTEDPLDVVEVRHNPWLLGLAATPFALAPLLWIVALATQTPAVAVPSIHAIGAGLFALMYVWRRNPWPQRVPVELRADVHGIEVIDREGRRRRRILREHIARGATNPTPRGATSLRITGRRFHRGTHLELTRKGTADRVLGDLGLDVHQSIASFRAMSRVQASGMRVFGLVVGMMATMAGAGALTALWRGAPVLAMPILMIAFFTLLFSRTTVDVGADGVLYRWLRRERFVAHDDIVDVGVTVHGFGRSKRNVVVLHLRGGETINLPTGAPMFDGDNAELLAARIRDARSARQRGALAPAALVRGEQSHAAWVSALRKTDAVDLRSQAPSKDDFWKVLEDVGAEPITRAAAAIALGRNLSEVDRERLARAQKTIAAPKLRVVLDRAPEADDEALAELLEKLEPKKGRA